ncbi:DUF1501 domain-containing protein [Glacieibacterium frigidum]|uniref:DUF1501 domain-containing protein n=1 Tax=Glacieibacterium frigidum TaxID=2593303 RepID=A0A552UG12_9SPHN|nr:DUF1501 domain-containing protein [Glacieibacterium frigidum]TRW17162.1 DUF1501 domain-containing protein [Glacieibacterium frigidum]
MTQLNRRALLAAAGLAAVPGISFAAAATERRFVFIILRGAMDGLGTVMPVGDPAYAALRGALAEPQQGPATKLNAQFALHPALAETASMYASGEAAFVHAVASPYRERSHFDAQNVLESGGTGAYVVNDGWLNRLVAALPGAKDAAIAIAPTVPLLLRGPVAVTSYAPSVLPQANEDLLARVGALYAGDAQLHPLWSQAIDARMLAGADAAGRANPVALGKLAATFLAKPGGPRVAAFEIGGWDTHAAQAARLNNQLKQLDGTLAALRTGLGAHWANTVVVAATEFGRTAAVNGTGGTDHGTGGVAILAGGAVRGGRVLGDWPGLGPSQLYEGRDLRPTTDLRALLLGVAADTFALDPARLSPALFPGGGVKPMGGLTRA